MSHYSDDHWQHQLAERNAEALRRFEQHPQRPEILRRWLDKPAYQRLRVQLRLGIATTGIPL